MTFKKLKTVLYRFALFSLFFGGFYGFCSFVNQNIHNKATVIQENGTTPIMSESASYCCTIQAHDSNTMKQFTSSIIQNRNFSGPDTFLLGLVLLISFFEFYNKIKKILVLKIYHLRKLFLVLHNYLLSAFSRGILHPKIYYN